MTPPQRPSDEQIQDYIDGRLRARDLALMTAYLFAHPKAASEIEALRRHNEALKQIGQEILHEPIPERLRSVLRRRPAGKANGSWPPRHITNGLAALTILIWWT
jgi:anti-sigma factor RsiW